MVADVVEAIGRRAGRRIRVFPGPGGIGLRDSVQDPQHTLDDVVDVGEVSAVLPVIEDGDRLARKDGAGEFEQGHVRPAPGAVYGEEAQSRGGQSVQVAVGVGHQLVGLFAGGVQAQRVVHIVVDGEGLVGIGAVDRAARSVDQVLDPVVAAALQDVGEAGQVGVHIGHRVLDGVTDPGLGGEVDDPLRPVPRKGLGDGGSVVDVDAQFPVAVVFEGAREPGLLQPHVVVVVEVVDSDDLVAARQESQGERGTDEAGAAGYQDLHDGLLIMRVAARPRSGKGSRCVRRILRIL